MQLEQFDVIGKSEEAVEQYLGDLGFTVRIKRRDGVSNNLSMDIKEDRFNLVIEKGLVTEATIG